MTEKQAIAEFKDRLRISAMNKYADLIPEYIEAMQLAISALEKQEKDRWIPVTERLPELDTDVLITDQYGDVWQATYIEWCGIERFVSAEESITIEDVVAWRPLPEAYKAEEEDE